jgi:cation-transporting ATPase F
LSGGESFAVSGVGYAPEGEFSCDGKAVDARQRPLLIECLKAGLLCNDSAVAQTEEGWQAEGDPTEAALIVSARKAGLSPETMKRELPRLDAIPFESQHQYMATLHKMGPDGSRVAYLKGSVESILQRCDNVFGDADSRPALDPDSVHRRVEELASDGLRVLALARAELPAGTSAIRHQDVASGLSFLACRE